MLFSFPLRFGPVYTKIIFFLYAKRCFHLSFGRYILVKICVIQKLVILVIRNTGFRMVQNFVLFIYLQGERTFSMSLMPCLNLCSRMWLKPNRNLVNNFIWNESLILRLFLWKGLHNVLRSRLYEIELVISGSSLFHSLMTLGMREFLKYLDLL